MERPWFPRMTVCTSFLKYLSREVLRSAIDDATGLKTMYEMIDNRADFKIYMQNYAYAHGGAARGPRREGPAEEGFVSFLVASFIRIDQEKLPPLPTHNAGHTAGQPSHTGAIGAVNGDPHMTNRGRPMFTINLAEQMDRDQVELPPILEKCCSAIEKYGLRSQGIYRISGMVRKVSILKERLDKG